MVGRREDELPREPYYHGLLPREDLKNLLSNAGDFILRSTEPVKGQPRQYVISVASDTRDNESSGFIIRHFIVNQHASGKYLIDGFGFDSIQDLIKHHLETRTSISTKGQPAIIRNPIGRQSWELNACDITKTKKLGEGAFGEVALGTWRTKSGETVNVAIKLAKLENLTKEQIKEVMREARTMRILDHPHVVRLYGVAALEEPLQLVMELASDGALDSYLTKNSVPESVKSEMCCQAAWGLEYLHSMKVIHRDIAARNCLYGGGKVKISDFGMSRDGPTYKMDPKRRVPIRWLSPETMRFQIYNYKTDVWSYGIMCWEIYHNGREPYPGMTPIEAHGLVMSGGRMRFEIPVHPLVYNLIYTKTWAENPEDRPSMGEAAKEFCEIVGIECPPFRPIQPHSDSSSAGVGIGSGGCGSGVGSGAGSGVGSATTTVATRTTKHGIASSAPTSSPCTPTRHGGSGGGGGIKSQTEGRTPKKGRKKGNGNGNSDVEHHRSAGRKGGHGKSTMSGVTSRTGRRSTHSPATSTSGGGHKHKKRS